jgi:hypothetical protein
MNARQARQRRHQWYFSPCAPFENSSEPEQAKDSTNNLSQTDDPTRIVVLSDEPERRTSPDDATSIVIPSEYHERGIPPELSPVKTVDRERGISPQLSPVNKPQSSPEAPALAAPSDPAQTDVILSDAAERRISPDDATSIVIPSEHRERGIPPKLSPVNAVEPERGTSPQQSVPRCQFSFSDGRHCRLPRAKTDPRFCPHHTANNVKAKKARKRSRASQAIVELATPSGKFTTATDLNHALSQVFRSLAQDRIRPRSAAAFGYLGQLLLQTLPGVKSEFSDTFGYRAWDESVKAMLSTGPRSVAAIKQPQPPQNQHLRPIPPHPSQNEHLRKP